MNLYSFFSCKKRANFEIRAVVFQNLSNESGKLMFIGLKARGIFESRRDVSL